MLQCQNAAETILMPHSKIFSSIFMQDSGNKKLAYSSHNSIFLKHIITDKFMTPINPASAGFSFISHDKFHFSR